MEFKTETFSTSKTNYDFITPDAGKELHLMFLYIDNTHAIDIVEVTLGSNTFKVGPKSDRIISGCIRGAADEKVVVVTSPSGPKIEAHYVQI